MQVRYKHFKGRCIHQCENKGNWGIEIIRSGNKPNFLICPSCGYPIKEEVY